MINPDHPVCPVLVARGIGEEQEAGECRQPLKRETVDP
jgi:hypothetical protein